MQYDCRFLNAVGFGDRQHYLHCVFDQTNYRSQVTNWYLRTTSTPYVYEVTEEYREVVGPCNSNLGVYLLTNSGYRLKLARVNNTSTNQPTTSPDPLFSFQASFYVSYTTAFRNQEQNTLRNFCATNGCCKTEIGKAHRIDLLPCVLAVCDGNPNQYGRLQFQDANNFVISTSTTCSLASTPGALDTIAYTRT
mgnify:FL=1